MGTISGFGFSTWFEFQLTVKTSEPGKRFRLPHGRRADRELSVKLKGFAE